MISSSVSASFGSDMYRSYVLTINGYFGISEPIEPPDTPGIYFVFTSTYYQKEKRYIIRQLLYVGSVLSLKSLQNETWNEFDKYLNNDREQICFAYSKLEEESLERVKNAIIAKHFPPANERILKFSMDETMIILNGKTGLLNPCFTVY